jgi:ABC-type branched-subunit amino acid transport system ATPase component/ABC-type branched-subunit amino acid transport system permease subunit
MIANVSISYLAELVMINALLALSEYIAIRTGVFSLATPAFGAIGGYVSASLLVHDHTPVAVTVVLAVLCSGLLGLVLALPLSRLRGVFQGIATLSVVIIMQNIAYLWTSFTGGAPGLQGIPRWAGLLPIMAIFVVTIFIVSRVDHSSLGHKMTAIRVDEVVAAANGINVFRYQLVALVASGMLGGLGGALLVGNQYAIDPSVFGFSLILQTVAAVFLGGLGSWIGPTIGALILTAIPQFLSTLAAYEGAVAGVLLIAVLVLLPGGVWPLLRLVGVRVISLAARLFQPREDPLHTSPQVLHVPVLNSASTSALISTSGSSSELRLNEPSKFYVPDKERVPLMSAESRRPRVMDGNRLREDCTLSVSSVFRSFAGVAAVSDVSFTLLSGQTIGLIGPNGAGKSTLVNLICGNLLLDSGSIELNGQHIEELSASMISRIGVRRTFQTCRLLVEETVLQNVLIGFEVSPSKELIRSILLRDGSGGHRPRELQAVEALALCGLADRAYDLAGSLPYAAQRRLEIARAVAPGNCRILLLDEPAAGMNDMECKELGELINNINLELNIGVLLIEHHVNFVFDTCDHVVVINSGSVIAEGTPEAVRSSEAVLDAYLGRRYA